MMKSGNKYGLFNIEDNLYFEFEDYQMELEKFDSKSYLYRRKKKENIISESIIFQDKGSKFGIYPIRPISQPQILGHHIMIKVDPQILLPPNSNITHKLTMPIEIGVFTSSGGINNHQIDSFSLTNPKYALYGLPETGYICRYYKSNSKNSENVTKYHEALIIMKFENTLDDWVTVNKIVMDAYMIDFYIKNDDVYLEDSSMVLEDPNVASIYLNNKSPLPELEEVPMANEEVKKFRLTILDRAGFGVSGKFIMEKGY